MGRAMRVLVSVCSIWLLAAGAAVAGFGLPYEIPYTDSSGQKLLPGGGVAATSKDPNSLDLWSIGKGGALINAGTWTAAQGWSIYSPFYPFSPSGLFTPGAGIAAKVRVPNTNTVDTFVLGDAGYLWNAGSYDGARWNGPYQQRAWTSISANTFVKGGGLAVNSRVVTLTDAFTIANDGCLWYAGGWDGSSGFKAPFKWPTSNPCKFVPGGGIAVNSRSSTMDDTWVIGTDGYLWNAGSFDGQFHAPYQHPSRLPHPFPPGAPVAAVSRDPTRVDVYAFDSDGSLWMVGGYVNSSPIAPYRVPTSAPASFLWAPGGPQGRLPLGGIAANTRVSSIADTWAIAPDGAVWNAGSWDSGTPFVNNTSACSHLPATAHVALAPALPPPVFAYATRLGRLTTGPQTSAATSNVGGADLGAAVETTDRRLSFLFGDTRPISSPWNGEDALAQTSQIKVARSVLPVLTYVPSGSVFTPFSVSAFGSKIDLGFNNTPQDGVILPSGKEFVFLGGGAQLVPKRSNSVMAMTASTGDSSSPGLSLEHIVNTNLFEYVSSYYEPDDGYVYIFGTGPGFRQSNAVYLARTTAACVQDRSSWTYFTGSATSAFETGEENARSIIGQEDHHNLGELSVRKVGSRYVMLYQAGDPSGKLPRGVFARFATSIAGSWSAPGRIWAPDPSGAQFAAVGYGSSMHRAEGSDGVPYDDGLAEPDTSADPKNERRDVYGGEYAPELMARYSKIEGGIWSLTYGLSLGNPYQVDLFRSVLTDVGVSPPPPPKGRHHEARLINADFRQANPLQGWKLIGGPFVPVSQGDTRFISTFGVLGAGTMGSLQQAFVPGRDTSSLCFSVCGGALDTPQYGGIEPNVSVRLLHDGAIVRESRPVTNMDPQACLSSAQSQVAWDLTEFRGERITLEVHDSRPSPPFGFIMVSPIQQGSGISASGTCQKPAHR